MVIWTRPAGVRVLKIDGAFAPRVLRFDSGLAAEGCGGRPSKRRGASLYKTFTTGLRPMENRPTALRAWKCAPPCPLRGTSPKGKRVTGFSVAQGLPTNPVPLPPRKRWQNKAPRNNYRISGTKQSTGCCAPAQRGGKGTRFVGECSDLRIV